MSLMTLLGLLYYKRLDFSKVQNLCCFWACLCLIDGLLDPEKHPNLHHLHTLYYGQMIQLFTIHIKKKKMKLWPSAALKVVGNLVHYL